MIAPAVRIVKLGGSLLDLADVQQRLCRWVADQPAMINAVVVGGGAAVESLRLRDRADGSVHRDSADLHWLAVRLMNRNMRRMARGIPGAQTVWQVDAVRRAARGGLVFLDSLRILNRFDRSPHISSLPWDWSVTSDSIAAALAKLLAATELTLLKSTTPADCRDWRDAADQGYVDAYFPTAVDGVEFAYGVNLRDRSAARWRPVSQTGPPADSGPHALPSP